MSRCWTCASSCARTPRSSSSERSLVIPCVTATAACFGLRPGREGVRLFLGDQVEARHRQAGAGRQFADDLVDPRRFGLLERLGAAHFQRQFVAEEVGAEVEQEADEEEGEGRFRPADQGADHDQQAGERRQQDRRADGRAEGGLLGGGHSVCSCSVGAAEKYCRTGRIRTMGGNPYSPALGRPGEIDGSTLARCDLGASAEHCGDRRARRHRGGSGRGPGRPAAALRAARGPDRGDGEGGPEPARAGAAGLDRRHRRDRGGRAPRARLPADDEPARGRAAAGWVRRPPRSGGGAGAGRARSPRRGQPVPDRAAAAARGRPRGGAARARRRGR